MEDIINENFWHKLFQQIANWSINELPSILMLSLFFFVGYKLSVYTLKRLRKVVLHRAEKSETVDTFEAEKRINTLTGIMRGLIKIVFWTVYLMIILKKFGVDIGPILASAGILGLAIGFGAQELVRDFISGFFILLENQIRTGDVAIIDGVEGLVETIELRTITLRDFSGVVHIFQNGKINSLSNMTKEWSASVLNIGIAYKEDVDQVIAYMIQVGNEMQSDAEYSEYIIQAIEVMGLDRFDDSAVVIKARIKTKPSLQWKVGREYRRRLKIIFDKQGVEIPFPHTTLYWGDDIKPLQLKLSNTKAQQIVEKTKE
jgi:small conductance mechanosensitive channel